MAKGEPVPTGTPFMGLAFKVGAAVLQPHAETELLCRRALALSACGFCSARTAMWRRNWRAPRQPQPCRASASAAGRSGMLSQPLPRAAFSAAAAVASRAASSTAAPSASASA